MSRISACLIALLLACAPLSLAESESLISQDLIAADTVNYRTITVERGDFAPTLTASCEEYYPETYSLGLEEGNAWFEKYYVSRGDEVKKGDVLASFTVETNEVELASLRLDLQNAQKALENRMEEEEEAALERQRTLLKTSDSYEREMILLQSERAELVCEQFELNQLRTIAQIEEKIDEILARQAGNKIISPVDGIVLSVEHKREGRPVYAGEILVVVCGTDNMLVRVDNASGLFKYGMEIPIEVSINKERIQLSGRVVGADTLIPTNERSNKSYIRLDLPIDYEGKKPTRASAVAKQFSLTDVTLVKRSALKQHGVEYYVTVLSDGVPIKKFVNCANFTNSQMAWVLQGLEPGDEIIID